MNVAAHIEAILFVSPKPYTLKRLAELTSASVEEVQAAVERLADDLDHRQSAIMVLRHGQEVELVTRPEVAEVVKQVTVNEVQGELTRAALEALTILAYRGPLTRPELEQIRGVQSSLILRNLLLRGLIEEQEDVRLGQPMYAVTVEFLKHLGVASVDSLPEYAKLRGHQAIADVLTQLDQSIAPSSSPSSSST